MAKALVRQTQRQLEEKREQRVLTLRRLQDLLRTSPERIAELHRRIERLRKDEAALPAEIAEVEGSIAYLDRQLGKEGKRERILKGIKHTAARLRDLREQAAELNTHFQKEEGAS